MNGEQRCENYINGSGHGRANRFFHKSDQKRPRNNSQYTALPAAKDRIQRDRTVIKAHDGGNPIDAVQRRDHAQHAAKDGCSSEAPGSAITGPGGQEGHHGVVDQRKDLVDKRPDVMFFKIRHGLRDERRGSAAKPGADDAGKQRNKNIADHFQSVPDSIPFHACSPMAALLRTSARTGPDKGSSAS